MPPGERERKEGEPLRDEDTLPSGGAEPGATPEVQEPQNLGILFIAAAIALAVLLTIVALLAYAAMSRTPPAPNAPSLRGAALVTPANSIGMSAML